MTDGQKRYLISKGPHQPRLKQFPRNDNIPPTKQRHFYATWYHDFPHLEYCVERDSAFCFVCSLFHTPSSYDAPLRTKHSNRKAYQLELIRCDDNPTCSHCTSLPTRDNPFLRLIKNFGGSVPTPIKNDFVKGHFQSLEDMLLRSTSSITKIKSSTGHRICPYAGCNYAFFSETDKKRHFFLMNHAEKDSSKKIFDHAEE